MKREISEYAISGKGFQSIYPLTQASESAWWPWLYLRRRKRHITLNLRKHTAPFDSSANSYSDAMTAVVADQWRVTIAALATCHETFCPWVMHHWSNSSTSRLVAAVHLLCSYSSSLRTCWTRGRELPRYQPYTPPALTRTRPYRLMYLKHTTLGCLLIFENSINVWIVGS